MSCVLAAIDLGPSSARVLFHAAGFARLLMADLCIIHVSADPPEEARQRVMDFCVRQGPYEIDFDQTTVVVRAGHVSEAVVREAREHHADLVVVGSRGHERLAKLLLGSSSEAILRNASVPVLLVPPVDMDIVGIADRVALTCGPILAAVDLAEDTHRQLALASRLAQIGSQSLLLMTVAPSKLTDHQASALLRERGHGLEPVRPRSLIVRRGSVPDEISECAVAEGSGLVVMGVRSKPFARPGVIASAVLRTKRAFVLAVPGGHQP
jgi:nucleotide-binding universal stress UspA family protein